MNPIRNTPMKKLLYHLYPAGAALVVAYTFTWLLHRYGLGAHAHGAVEGVLIGLLCWYAGWHTWNPGTRSAR